jgi:hypothetical protein
MAKVVSKLLLKIQMIETIKHITLELIRNVSPKFALHALIHCTGVGIPSVTMFMGQYHFNRLYRALSWCPAELGFRNQMSWIF